MGAVRASELERVIVDTTVQEKAIAHPADSRLPEIARHKVATAAKRAGIALKQTFVREGKQLRRKAGGYAHAKQFKRLRRTVKRQRTIRGVVIRDARRGLQRLVQGQGSAPQSAAAVSELNTLLERAERIRTQQHHSKNKLHALHAPEVACVGKGKARKPYEFGVKTGIVITHRHGLIAGARTFPGNPYDGHALAEQLQQTEVLLEDIGIVPKTVVVDLGFRGVDAMVPKVTLLHRGRAKTLTAQQWRWVKRRQAVEPVSGHTKLDHRMYRCWPAGATGDALHAVLCAAGFNIRWLLRAIQRKGLRALLAALMELWRTLGHGAPSLWRALSAQRQLTSSQRSPGASPACWRELGGIEFRRADC